MKILMYGWEFPPHISGGLGTACYGLTRALAALGHEITFVLPRISASGNQESHVKLVSSDQVEMECRSLFENMTGQESDSIRIEALPSTLQPYANDAEYRKLLAHLELIKSEMAETVHSSKISMAGDYGANLMEEIARYARVAGAIARKVDHEVIHAHDWMTLPAGLEAKKASGRPLVVHVHSLEFDRSGDSINPEVYAIERKGMEKADKIVAVSQFTKNKITRHYGIKPGKITVVHNGVIQHAEGHGFPVRRGIKKKTVLFLGRVTFQKGPDYFVEAAARVISVRKDVCFVMSGCGDMLHRMIERVAELKIGRYFHFTGFLRGTEVARMYRMSDLYIMPSVSEPFGISPLEAMQQGVPVIISRQSGISEVVGSVFKVNFWDVKELAAKMLAVLNYDPLKKAMVHNAHRELDNITWEKAAGKVTEVYGQFAQAV